LVAFVVPERHGGRADELTAELRAHLRRRVPRGHIPQQIIEMPELPLTRRGKIDVERLVEVATSAQQSAVSAGARHEVVHNHSEDDRSELVHHVAVVMAEVIGIAVVNPLDDFFVLGGHSILAARLVSMIRRKLRVKLTIQDVFEAPTAEGLARRIALGRVPSRGSG
jgi:hypothetical protein